MNPDNNTVQHISIFNSLLYQVGGINARVDNYDPKAIFLISMSSSFRIIFTLNKINLDLEAVIFSLLEEIDCDKQHELNAEATALLVKQKMNISKTSSNSKNKFASFYCKQFELPMMYFNKKLAIC